MQCPRCHSDARANQRFCAQCGVNLDQSCSACGFSNLADAKFCSGCGHPLRQALGTMHRDLRSLGTAPPQHLAARILASRPALEGKRREVTVLVGDIVGSDHRGDADDKAKCRLTEEAFRFMVEAVRRHYGMVDHDVDDGVLALFGAPVPLHDHALGAVKAALGIKNALSGYSQQLREERGVEVQARLGLNSGQVVVRRIADDLRMDYVSVGDTTELAGRLLDLAEPGTILIAEATYRLVAEWVASEPVVPLRLTGRADAICAYRLTGRRRGGSPRPLLRVTKAATTGTNCPRCEQPNRLNARFCQSCGAELRTLCRSCGTPMGPSSTFCDACGVRL